MFKIKFIIHAYPCNFYCDLHDIKHIRRENSKPFQKQEDLLFYDTKHIWKNKQENSIDKFTKLEWNKEREKKKKE